MRGSVLVLCLIDRYRFNTAGGGDVINSDDCGWRVFSIIEFENTALSGVVAQIIFRAGWKKTEAVQRAVEPNEWWYSCLKLL